MKHKVLIMRCAAYDSEAIARIVEFGMDELGVQPAGRVLLKPNAVLAHPQIFPYAFTRAEFLDGVIRAIKSRAKDLEEIAVGERCGITIPTRYSFKNAGYLPVLKRHRVKAYYFDEVKHVPVPLKGPRRLRDTLLIPKPVVQTDFLINLPKFKAHPWCRLTLSLKNYIGIQDDRYRLLDHNSFLEHKIADLQEIVPSRFIAVDAIVAGQKMMLTPTPFPMGAIVMGTNSCAVDTVGCHMVHVDPKDVVHLRYSAERGFGPMSLEEIEVAGDFPLEEVRGKTRHFQFCMTPIDEYFTADGNLRCKVGEFPEKHSSKYCWGGCPGSLQEAMHIFKGFYPDVYEKMKKVRYVVGRVTGDLEIEEGEQVIFAGDCTAWDGEIGGKPVKIKDLYESHGSRNEARTGSSDMLLKTAKTLWACFRHRNSRVIRIRGCPISVADHVHYLSAFGKIKNVNFDPRLLIPVNIAYWQMRAKRLFNRLFE